MRLLFLIFMAAVLVACDKEDKASVPSEWKGDWNNPANENYVPQGYDPIEGEWLVASRNDTVLTDTIIHFFTKEREWKIAKKISTKTHEPEYGQPIAYKINSEQILTGVYLHPYTIDEEKQLLTLHEKEKKFVMVPFVKQP